VYVLQQSLLEQSALGQSADLLTKDVDSCRVLGLGHFFTLGRVKRFSSDCGFFHENENKKLNRLPFYTTFQVLCIAQIF
jgi:hypothetical protein